MESKSLGGIITASVSSVINLCLALAKIFIGIVSNSVSIFFDGINNIGDIFSSAGGAIGLAIAKKKPTKDFPHGYNKAEEVTTFVISWITFAIGFVFVFYSVERMLYPTPIVFSWLYFGVLLATAVVKLIMGVAYVFADKKYRSGVTKSLKLDSFLDAGITLSTVICYAVCLVTNTIIDAILGLIIGVAVLYSSGKIFVNAVKQLVGYESDEYRDKLGDSLVDCGLFDEIEDIKVFSYGKNRQAVVIGKLNRNDDTDRLLQQQEEENKIKLFIDEEHYGKGKERENG